MKKHIFILLLFCGITSCSKISSGGFWREYRTSEIVSEKLDHGPYGGTTEIHWKGKKPFSINKIIQLGKENGWNLVDTTKTNLDFSNEILNYRFDKTEIDDKTILYLKSNLMTIQEDQDLETLINCFVILNSQRNELIIYHYWGDF